MWRRFKPTIRGSALTPGYDPSMNQTLQRVDAPPTPLRPRDGADRIPFHPDGRTRFTREGYLKLVEVGLLEEDAPVELLEGEIVPMSPISPGHSGVLRKLIHFFTPRVEGRGLCLGGGSIAVEENSMPEPDFMISRFRDDFYVNRLATAEDSLLLVEIAVTSLKQDLGRKAKIYARGGAAEYWVAEPERQTLHVHRRADPAEGRWAEITRRKPGEKVAALAFPDAELDLGWLFG